MTMTISALTGAAGAAVNVAQTVGERVNRGMSTTIVEGEWPHKEICEAVEGLLHKYAEVDIRIPVPAKNPNMNVTGWTLLLGTVAAAGAAYGVHAWRDYARARMRIAAYRALWRQAEDMLLAPAELGKKYDQNDLAGAQAYYRAMQALEVKKAVWYHSFYARYRDGTLSETGTVGDAVLWLEFNMRKEEAVERPRFEPAYWCGQAVGDMIANGAERAKGALGI